MPDYKPRSRNGEQQHHVYVIVREKKKGEFAATSTTTTHYVESCDTRNQAYDVVEYMNDRVPRTDEAVYHKGDYVPAPPYDKSRLKEKGNNDPIEKEMISL